MDELDDVARAALEGDLEGVSRALVRRAGDKLAAGKLDAAADDLASAADLHERGGRLLDASRCNQARATTLRALGQLEASVDCALRARALAPADSPLRVSACTELGEGYLSSGRMTEAIEAYQGAVACGAAIGLLPVAQAAIVRRIAMARSMLGDHLGAASAARDAAALFAQAGETGGASAARVEAATALVAAGLGGPATQAIAEARAGAGGDPAALADLELLETARAMAADRLDDSLAHARHARAYALEAGAVLQYTGAAFAIAELLDRRGDRAGAYDSLAVGWVTAGDRIGEPHAAALFRPKLEELRARWGVAAFDAVKTAYYASRRS